MYQLTYLNSYLIINYHIIKEKKCLTKILQLLHCITNLNDYNINKLESCLTKIINLEKYFRGFGEINEEFKINDVQHLFINNDIIINCKIFL